MKPIQIMMDETLLRRLDRDREVRIEGRSAVLRRATAEYLRRSSARRIAEAYRKAYSASPGATADFSGWAAEGAWPEN
jgi:metal-responsive CopG/Arc/MetJ family transcriptional regulator